MEVLERGFLNNAKGIKIDDRIAEWVEQMTPINCNPSLQERIAQKKEEWTVKSIKENGGVRIQIEDWSNDYPKSNKNPYGHVYADVIGTYPISKKSLFKNGIEYPKLNKSFRFELKFSSTEEAREAYEKLLNGEKSILDYMEYFEQPEFACCL